MKPTFRVTFREALSLVKKNIKVIVLISLVNLILLYLLQITLLYLLKSINLIVFFVISNVLNTLVWLFNYSLLVILIVSKEALQSIPIIKQLHYIFRRLIPMIITWYLYELTTIVGLLFFIIPGVIFAEKYSQALNFALIDGENPLNAFKSSARVTKGNYLQLMGLSLVFGILAGILCLPALLLPLSDLIKAGYYSFIINCGIIVNYVIWKTLKQTPSPQTTPQTMSPRKKNIIIAILVIIIAIMAFMIIRSLRAIQQIRTNSNNAFMKRVVNEKIKQIAPNTDTELTNTNNWQIYTNEKYRYEIKYPPKFTIKSMWADKYPDIHTSPEVTIGSSYDFKYVTISVDMYSNKQANLNEYVDNAISNYSLAIRPHVIKTSNIAGKKAIFVSNEINTKKLILVTYIEKDPFYVIEISLGPVYQGAEQEYTDFFYQIVSTVKFKD